MAFSAILSALLCLTLTSSGTCRPGLVGQVSAISSNESVELYLLASSSNLRLISAQMELYLRPPCPACHPSYNYIWHDDQLILPSTEVATFFKFLSEEPYIYTEVVPLPECEPLSIFKSSYTPNSLYLDCRDRNSDEQKYFLAQLEKFVTEEGKIVWIYNRLGGFGRLQQAGTYLEIEAFTSVYVHEVDAHLEFNGFITGYFSSLDMPSNCSHMVRITATGNDEDLLLFECSSSESNSLVTDIFVVRSTGSVHLLSTSPYSLCPVRLLDDGTCVAIFSKEHILLIDLASESFKNFNISHAVYDGVITHSTGDDVYLVYSTALGLFRAHMSINRKAKDIILLSVSVFPDTATVCASEGCPLLTLVDEDVILVTLNGRISTFSIATLQRIAPDIHYGHIPSRIVFHEVNSSVLLTNHTSTYCETTLAVPYFSMPPDRANLPIGSDHKKVSITAAVTILASLSVLGVILLVGTLVVRSRKRSHRTKQTSLKTWYRRSSDTVELISNNSESVTPNSSINSSLIVSRICFQRKAGQENSSDNQPALVEPASDNLESESLDDSIGSSLIVSNTLFYKYKTRKESTDNPSTQTPPEYDSKPHNFELETELEPKVVRENDCESPFHCTNSNNKEEKCDRKHILIVHGQHYLSRTSCNNSLFISPKVFEF